MRRRRIDRDLDRILSCLRNRIREQGFTQMEVQEVLGWGRSYLSQLLTRQKTARVDQVLMVLNVIGVDPAAFFAEVYSFGEPRRLPLAGRIPATAAGGAGALPSAAELRRLRSLYRGLVSLLRQKGYIDAAELARAVEKARTARVPVRLRLGGQS